MRCFEVKDEQVYNERWQWTHVSQGYPDDCH